MNSLIWGVAPRAAMFCCDVTKREVSSLFSMVAVWLRWVRLADQNQLVLPSPPSTQTMDGWARGHGPQPFGDVQLLFRLPSVPPSRFLGDWTAPARALGVKPLAPVVVVVVCLFVEAPPFPSNRFSAVVCALSFATCRICRPRSMFCLFLFGWKCLERRRTIERRCLIDRNPAISPCVSIYTPTEQCLRCFFLLFKSLKCCKYPHVLTITGSNH